MRYSKPIQKQVVKLYKRGYSLDEICQMERMPATPKTVARILQKNRVKRRVPSRVFDHDKIRADLKKYPNETIAALAARHGCTTRLIFRIKRAVKEEQKRQADALRARRALQLQQTTAEPQEKHAS